VAAAGCAGRAEHDAAAPASSGLGVGTHAAAAVPAGTEGSAVSGRAVAAVTGKDDPMASCATGAMRDVAAGVGSATGGPAGPASALPTDLQWIAAGS
jgi:hypothetical protein